MAEPQHLTVAEAAKLLRCSQQTVRRRIKLLQLRVSQPSGRGGKLLVSRASAEALLPK